MGESLPLARSSPTRARPGAEGEPTRFLDVGRARLRSLAGVGFGAFLVLATGLTDGGYYGTAWTAVSVVLVAGSVIAMLLDGLPRLRRGAWLAIAACGALTAWIAVSSRWADAGADTWLETRRALLYTIALVTAIVVATSVGRRAVLTGLAAGTAIVGLTALALRLEQGITTDRLFGVLLEEPVGYPNALGAVAAIGCVLSLGLAHDPGTDRRARRALRGLAPVLVLVLGLTESRGAALALLVAVGVLLALAPGVARPFLTAATLVVFALGGTAWLVAERLGADGAGLAAIALSTAALGAGIGPRRLDLRLRTLAALAGAVGFGLVALVLLQPDYGTSSFRTSYWQAAVAELSSRPVHGSGAGTFHLTWLEHRTVETDVRDAHSVYVETLSELGAVGLALLSILVLTPLVVVWRGHRTLVVASAGAAFALFAIHAGLDWDWELPVVTLVGLGCAGVLLAAPRETTSASPDGEGSRNSLPGTASGAFR